MEIIKRKGSLTLIKDRNDEYWLARRVKLRCTTRRGKLKPDYRSVRYMPFFKVNKNELDFFL